MPAGNYQPARHYLEDALSAGKGFLPDSVMAPIRELYERPDLAERLSSPSGAVAKAVFGPLSIDPQHPFLAGADEPRLLNAVDTFLDLGRLRYRAPILAPPVINEIRAANHGDPLCCPTTGAPLATWR